MVPFGTSDSKKIGLGLIGYGVFFTWVGMLLFLDKRLLALGNIFFSSGVILAVGPNSALQFLLNLNNYKASAPLAVGFFFVITGWPIVGMITETCGFIVLLWGFWPVISFYLRRFPIVGWILRQSYKRQHFSRPRGRRVPV